MRWERQAFSNSPSRGCASRTASCRAASRVTNVDPSFRSQVLTENSERPVRRVMSNSFGFGGINCSLIVGTA